MTPDLCRVLAEACCTVHHSPLSQDACLPGALCTQRTIVDSQSNADRPLSTGVYVIFTLDSHYKLSYLWVLKASFDHNILIDFLWSKHIILSLRLFKVILHILQYNLVNMMK